MLLFELRGEFRGEKNIIMWMPLGGQVNALKGKQTERKRGQKLYLAAVHQIGGWERGAAGCKSVIAGAC